MTREEREDAIDIIQSILDKYEEDECLVTEITIGDEDIKAFKMAIKALEQEPCEDAISRRAIIDMTGLSEWFDSSDSYNEFVIALSELPSVTPQLRTGHWIAQDIHNCHTDFKCSECGYIHNFMHIFGEPIADYTYCPNCGAKMVDPQGSE